ncbi:Membrane protease subunit, stomatin/prohibitin [Balamuthia mandrillaris]
MKGSSLPLGCASRLAGGGGLLSRRSPLTPRALFSTCSYRAGKVGPGFLAPPRSSSSALFGSLCRSSRPHAFPRPSSARRYSRSTGQPMAELFRQTKLTMTTAAAIAGAVVVVAACSASFCVVPAGHVGLIDFFGDVRDLNLPPGFHFKNPLARCVLFSTKTQRVETTALVPSSEGLTVQLEVSALYRLDPTKASHVYKTLGTKYADVVLLPHFKSIIRELTSGHEAKGLYTAQVRTQISNRLKLHLNEVLKERGIIVDETPINGIIMPERLVVAIEEKLRAEQEAERMSWVLQREEAEAKRKVIEAKGISEFQRIVTEGISEPLLRWKGIEATEKLAQSPNAKMVVIGKTDGLPLVLAP